MIEGPLIAFRLGKGLNALIVVSAHSHLGNVYIAIAHSDAGQILFLGSLTGSSELSDGTNRSSLGGLSAGVGVNLGVEHQNVHVLTGSDDVIQTAEADIISPAVAAEDPHGFLRQEVLVGQGLLCKLADLAVISGGLFQLSDQSVGSNPVSAGIV